MLLHLFFYDELNEVFKNDHFIFDLLPTLSSVEYLNKTLKFEGPQKYNLRPLAYLCQRGRTDRKYSHNTSRDSLTRYYIYVGYLKNRFVIINVTVFKFNSALRFALHSFFY